MPSAKRDNLINSFPIYSHFVSFFRLTGHTKTSSSTLNESSNSVRPCAISYFRGMFYVLPCLVQCQLLICYIAFIISRYVSSIPNVLGTHHKEKLNSEEGLFGIYSDQHVVSVHNSTSLNYLTDLHTLIEQTSHPKIKLPWAQEMLS